MKRIVLHATGFDSFWAHFSLVNDEYFKQGLLKQGFDLVHSNKTEVKDTDYILFMEVKSLNNPILVLPYLRLLAAIKYLAKTILSIFRRNKPLNYNLYNICKKEGSVSRTVLMIMEGVIDAPENHSPVAGSICPFLLTWNNDLVNEKNIIKFNWPQPAIWPEIPQVDYAQRKMMANISANKYSTHRLELYSTRRNAIQYFQDRFGDQFDLYGIGWNEPVNIWQRRFKFPVRRFSSYKGKINSKAEVFPYYRFALVYENASVPGWITEKIFDCMRCDCVPVYLGAPNITDYVPADLFIDQRNFGSDEELGDFLEQMNEKVFDAYRLRIRTYLQSDAFTSHLSTSLANKVADTFRTLKKSSD